MDRILAEDTRLEFSRRESLRRREFGKIWDNDLHAVFADVAPYYDLASNIASLGLYGRWQHRFVSAVGLRPGLEVLDLCAGTNAIGLGLLRREPSLRVTAMDRSAAMQEVGGRIARSRGFEIESEIGDAHALPFPDESFDLVTLGWASRHLRIAEVFSEVRRVLRPRGRFHHCDMLRPENPAVERLYCGYLKACLAGTALIFGSGREAWSCRDYFVHAIRTFYSAEELSELLAQTGFDPVRSTVAPGGVLAFHEARKP